MWHNKKMTPGRLRTGKKMKKVVENFDREEKLKKLELQEQQSKALDAMPSKDVLSLNPSNA